MKLYPLNIKIDGMVCVVVGGGGVALRKVKGLLACGARVTVVSPHLCPGLAALARQGMIQVRKSAYERRFLSGSRFVIAATDDTAVNARVSRDAFLLNVFVNAVDEPQHCTAFLPSVVRSDPILVSLATSGCFPGLSKKMRRELTPVLREYAQAARACGRLRQLVKQASLGERTKKRLIRALLQPRVMAAVKKGRVRTIASLAAAIGMRLPERRNRG